jgi:hypothetical protein
MNQSIDVARSSAVSLVAGAMITAATAGLPALAATTGMIWASNEAMAAVIEHGTESFVEYAASQGRNQEEAVRFAQTTVWAVESVATGAAVVGIAKLVQNKTTVADKIKTLKANVSSVATRAFQRTQSSKVRVDTTSLESIARTIEQCSLAKPKMIKHHVFNVFRGEKPETQKYRDFFKKHKINVHDYCIEIPATIHTISIHGKTNWTGRWRSWIDANPNATTKEVYQFAGKLMDEYGVAHVPLKKYK